MKSTRTKRLFKGVSNVKSAATALSDHRGRNTVGLRPSMAAEPVRGIDAQSPRHSEGFARNPEGRADGGDFAAQRPKMARR